MLPDSTYMLPLASVNFGPVRKVVFPHSLNGGLAIFLISQTVLQEEVQCTS